MTLSFVGSPGEIVVTDNGGATDFNIFSSHDRRAFNYLPIVTIKVKRRQIGPVVLTVEYDSLQAVTCTVLAR